MYRQKWTRVTSDLSWAKEDETLVVSFDFNVNSKTSPENFILFAYTYPYTFADIEYSIAEVQAKVEAVKNRVYFCRETIG